MLCIPKLTVFACVYYCDRENWDCVAHYSKAEVDGVAFELDDHVEVNVSSSTSTLPVVFMSFFLPGANA